MRFLDIFKKSLKDDLGVVKDLGSGTVNVAKKVADKTKNADMSKGNISRLANAFFTNTVVNAFMWLLTLGSEWHKLPLKVNIETVHRKGFGRLSRRDYDSNEEYEQYRRDTAIHNDDEVQDYNRGVRVKYMLYAIIIFALSLSIIGLIHYSNIFSNSTEKTTDSILIATSLGSAAWFAWSFINFIFGWVANARVQRNYKYGAYPYLWVSTIITMTVGTFFGAWNVLNFFGIFYGFGMGMYGLFASNNHFLDFLYMPLALGQIVITTFVAPWIMMFINPIGEYNAQDIADKLGEKPRFDTRDQETLWETLTSG